MASSCPPTGAGHLICEITKWPNLGPSSPGAGQIAGHAIGSVAGSALHVIAAAMAGAADGLIKTLSAMWMNVNTPGLGTAARIQTETRWITTAVAVVCILVAAGQMALRRRGQPAAAMFAGLTRVVVVGAAATFLVQTAGALSDTFSSDLMSSTVAHVGSGGWSGIISTATISSMIAPGDAMTLIIALLIIISSLIQLMLMILRTGLLVILTGTLPLAAAASMSDWGQTWWRKHLGWLVAWLLYKPAAALLYVSAFQLTQGKALVEVLAGFMILILSVLILPALLKVIVPATSNLGAASGGSLTMAAAGALATGAVRAGLHMPPVMRGHKSSSAPGDDGGPSGAGAVTGDTPPAPSPSSPPSRSGTIPTATGSSGGQAAPASSESPSGDQQATTNKTSKAARLGPALAAGISANSPSWRSAKDSLTDKNENQPDKRTLDGPENREPSGAHDEGEDDSPRENGG
jgi:hypothetical protein